MPNECTSSKTISVSESIKIVTELVDKTDDLRSKFKGIFLNYDLNIEQYNFVEEVYFIAPMPPKGDKNIEIGSEIILDLPIKKIYIPLTPGFLQPDQDNLIKIIVECECEYTRNGKIQRKSRYEIPM